MNIFDPYSENKELKQDAMIQRDILKKILTVVDEEKAGGSFHCWRRLR